MGANELAANPATQAVQKVFLASRIGMWQVCGNELKGEARRIGDDILD
jgi:hypothetical protein